MPFEGARPVDGPAIEALFRFPVKGLSPEALDVADLRAGDYVPGDRRFAIENGPSGFDAADPTHLPKTKFLMLMRDEKLVRLRTRFDPHTGRLSVRIDGTTVCEAVLDTVEGRAALEAYLAGYVAESLLGPPKVLAAGPGHRFTDSRKGFVSLLNLASVAAVAEALGRPVDPLRFRANVLLRGAGPWVENGWLGRRLRIGPCLLEVTALTERCAATSVDPATGARDMNIVKTLVRRFGHNVCGVYASVVRGGELRTGDAVELLP